MTTIDLNADVGETPGDLGMMEYVTSANIACGGHAGDESSMTAAVEHAVAHGVVVGAHPSYPDRAGFGRRHLDVGLGALAVAVADQVRSLDAIARRAGVAVRYLKMHGALYHRLGRDEECAAALLEELARTGFGPVAVLAQPGAAIAAVASRLGWPAAAEAFCDRAYGADGVLVERGLPGALLGAADEAAAQALSLTLAHGVQALDGSWIAVRADSLCLHGDTPGAIGLSRQVSAALTRAGVVLQPFVAR
ncbi:MAG TPA: 5-oxoprolinase subunit PxpA [Acidimicrobiales bacterium]|nr:5-oxoprolinase subunit PxpA [Acidimicrobiales bacterium]